VHTARAVYAVALAAFPAKSGIWRAAASLEKSHGTREQLHELLER
jgi:pre-mRNA-processing factor 6